MHGGKADKLSYIGLGWGDEDAGRREKFGTDFATKPGAVVACAVIVAVSSDHHHLFQRLFLVIILLQSINLSRISSGIQQFLFLFLPFVVLVMIIDLL